MSDDLNGFEGPRHWLNNVTRAREALEKLVARVDRAAASGEATTWQKLDAARDAKDAALLAIVLPLVRLAGDNTRARALLKRVDAALDVAASPKN